MKSLFYLLAGTTCAVAFAPHVAHAQATGGPSEPERAIVAGAHGRLHYQQPNGFERTIYVAQPVSGSDNLLVDPTAPDLNSVAISAVVSRPASGSESRQAKYNVTLVFERRGTVPTGAKFGLDAYASGDVTDVDYDAALSIVSLGASASGHAPVDLGNGAWQKSYLVYGRKEDAVDNTTSSYTVQGEMELRAVALAYPTNTPPSGTVAGP